MNTENDSRRQRCPKLGHEIDFRYCREENQKFPCKKILDCWWQTFDIQSFMQANYSSEVLNNISAPPTPKVLSLLELIEQAKQNANLANGK